MPSAVVDASFKARLAANPITGVTMVGIPGSTEPPGDSSTFLVVQYPVVNGNKPSLGRRYFEEGAARLVLNVQRGIESTDGFTWADTLASLFRDRDLGSGVQTFTPDGPIVNDTNDDGAYFSLSIIVPYRYQFDST